MVYFISFVFFFTSYNSPEKCINLIMDQKFSEAKAIYSSLNNNLKSEEMTFLNAYYTRSADITISIYEDLYLNSKNSKIKYLATKKLFEYYYAKGLYIKAQNLNSLLNQFHFNKNVDISDIKHSQYVIQCGVFGLESNALALKEKIATIVKNKVYLSKDVINKQEVIRVLISNISSYEQAENIKRLVDTKFSLNAMIKESEE